MVRFAFKSPFLIIVIFLMMLVLGLFTLTKMPLDILPTFRIPAVMVVTTYTGMPAKMMETDITNRLERWLSQAAGLDHMESRSMIGVSILNCFFEPGFDPNNALSQISTLVMSDLHYLPPGTQPPIVIGYDPTASLPVGLLSIFTPGLEESQLWDESNYIVRNQINAVPGAVAPVVFGGVQRQIMVYLDPKNLTGYGQSPLEVVEALQKGNSLVPTGDVKIGKYDLSLVANGMVDSITGFDQIPLKISNGAPVFLKDVGHAKDASAVQSNVVQVNGVKQTYIPLFRRVGASTLKVVDNIMKAIPNVLLSLPDQSTLKLVFDQSPKIREAISDVIRELVLGVFLASIVIYLFLGSLRPTLIASFTIPLALIGGIVLLYYMGQTLNLMTLGGFALITGPLIDMAVVALENIERHLEHGLTVREASERGVSEMTLPVLMACLALIVVFFPVSFFEGLGKFLFIPLALAVSATEIVSFFAVMTVVPLLASRLLKPVAHGEGHKNRIVRIFNDFFHKVRHEYYSKLLDMSLQQPKNIVALSVIAFFLSLGLLPFLGTEFFPKTEAGQFNIRVRAENGTRLENTSKLVDELTKTIHEVLPHESVETVLANSGVISSWAAAYSPNSASHDSLLQVALSEHSSIGAFDAMKKLRTEFGERYPDVRFSFSLIDPVSSALNYGALSSIDLRLVAPDLEKGQKIAADLLNQVTNVSGVKDAFIEQELNYPGLSLSIDRTKAAYLGLSIEDVMKNVITALNSSVLFSPNFWDDPISGNNYFIGAMYPEKKIDSVEVIQNIPILPRSKFASTSTQPIEPTLLRNIATISKTTLPVEISHFNIQRTFDIVANVEGRDIGSVASEIDKLIKRIDLPKRFSIQWAGEVDSMRKSFGNMGVGMMLSLVLIFLLMVAQLKSFVDPLLILATVPMGFIGVIWILFLTNTTINIQSMMGMIMLIGIVVSNTVIILDFANQRLLSGVTPDLAIRDAGLTRLRPILMTAISAIMALIPSSLGGANAPLARAVIGGLITSTFLSLVFLPALYVLVKKARS